MKKLTRHSVIRIWALIFLVSMAMLSMDQLQVQLDGYSDSTHPRASHCELVGISPIGTTTRPYLSSLVVYTITAFSQEYISRPWSIVFNGVTVKSGAAGSMRYDRYIEGYKFTVTYTTASNLAIGTYTIYGIYDGVHSANAYLQVVSGAPPAPLNFALQGSESPCYDGSVTFTWSKSQGATGYYIKESTNYYYDFNVIRKTVVGGDVLSTTINNPFTTYETRYYRICAYNAAGEQSYLSTNCATVKWADLQETDGDGLRDYDEIYKYYTDPENKYDPLGNHFEFDTIGLDPTGWTVVESEESKLSVVDGSTCNLINYKPGKLIRMQSSAGEQYMEKYPNLPITVGQTYLISSTIGVHNFVSEDDFAYMKIAEIAPIGYVDIFTLKVYRDSVNILLGQPGYPQQMDRTIICDNYMFYFDILFSKPNSDHMDINIYANGISVYAGSFVTYSSIIECVKLGIDPVNPGAEATAYFDNYYLGIVESAPEVSDIYCKYPNPYAWVYHPDRSFYPDGIPDDIEIYSEYCYDYASVDRLDLTIEFNPIGAILDNLECPVSFSCDVLNVVIEFPLYAGYNVVDGACRTEWSDIIFYWTIEGKYDKKSVYLPGEDVPYADFIFDPEFFSGSVEFAAVTPAEYLAEFYPGKTMAIFTDPTFGSIHDTALWYGTTEVTTGTYGNMGITNYGELTLHDGDAPIIAKAVSFDLDYHQVETEMGFDRLGISISSTISHQEAEFIVNRIWIVNHLGDTGTVKCGINTYLPNQIEAFSGMQPLLATIDTFSII